MAVRSGIQLGSETAGAFGIGFQHVPTLCNAVAPGMVQTGALDRVFGEEILKAQLATQGVARLGTPEEVAAVVLFLASDEASYVTGQHWSVCGGLSPQ